MKLISNKNNMKEHKKPNYEEQIRSYMMFRREGYDPPNDKPKVEKLDFEEINRWFQLEGKTDTTNLGS